MDANPWTADLERIESKLREPATVLNAIVDKAVLPALARNYRDSGLRQKTGLLFRGVTQRGSVGNFVRVNGDTVTVGVERDGPTFYSKYAIEGRGPVVARPGKTLRFVIDGVVFFRKRVKRAPQRPVYYLTPGDVFKAKEAAVEVLTS